MKNAALRWTVFGLFVAATIAAAYSFWTTERASRSASVSADNFRDRSGTLARAVMELRMAQQAYVAAGQGDEFWASRVAAQIASAREQLAALRERAAAAQAQAEVDDAIAALADFDRMDTRAREYARGNQLLLASDLIFSDGLDKTTAILDALERARTVEADAAGRVVRASRQRQFAVTGAIVAAALAMGLVLGPAPRAAPVDAPLDRNPAVSQAADDSLLLRDVRDPLPPLPAETPSAMREARTEAKNVFDLDKVASLCTELARLIDTRSLPRVLERTASVLDANGVVLWIADPDGRELNPIVTHGYPPQLVTRLGTIPRDAQNATAAAFRTALLQTVHADDISNGAIAVPLLTPAGCVGVMAAEVRHGGEKQDSKLAAAAIVAAQLATLVGPPPSRNHSRAEVAGA
jgi:hypothetical protein